MMYVIEKEKISNLIHFNTPSSDIYMYIHEKIIPFGKLLNIYNFEITYKFL